MGNSRTKFKRKMPVAEIILRFFFGFLIPFVLINGIIFFLFIQTPKIQVVEQDSKDYEENKIKFSVNCLLPVTDVKTYYQESEIAYSKLGSVYIINADNNGAYKINVTALNNSTANSIIEIDTQDSVPPTIDLDSAVITGNTLIISVHDNQSGINYDNLYATLENGTRLNPTYIDKSSGTVQFQITEGKKVVVHVEDDFGNHSNTSFTIS